MTFKSARFKPLELSRDHTWQTPPALFASLDAEFHFTLDAAADRANALTSDWLDEHIDALTVDWPGVVWCNPPYGRLLPRFVRKGYEESVKGSTVVFLIPARTDTKVWHDTIFPHAEVRFISGRLRFLGIAGQQAPFPSAIVIFRPKVVA